MTISERAHHLASELEAAGARKFDEAGQSKVHRLYAGLTSTELNYGTTILYLLQQIHGHHFERTYKKGYYFSSDNGLSVCPFTIAKRPYREKLAVVVTSPRGENVLSDIVALANAVQEIDENCAFYVKNPPSRINEEIQRRCKQEITPWYKTSAYEDDTFPNIIVDVPDITGEISLHERHNIKGGKRYRNVKQKIRGLDKRLNNIHASIDDFSFKPFAADDYGIARKIINTFFFEKRERGHLSKPSDYYNIFREEAVWRPDGESVIRAFLCFQNEPLGLVAAERIGGPTSNLFGIYSLLLNNPPMKPADDPKWNISELQTVKLLNDIRLLGGLRADLGGAETAELQEHHLKFLPGRPSEATKAILRKPQTGPWLEF